jgi:phosphoenolpyruvate carboxykinase (ATP)
LSDQGIATGAKLNWNLETQDLVDAAVARGEGRLAAEGPLVVETGKFTGRSPKDKFTVKDAETAETIWWGKSNSPMQPEHFAALKADFLSAVAEKDELFVQDLFGGSQPEYRVGVRVINEFAWHNLFIRTMLVRPEAGDLPGFVPDYTMIYLPSFRADPARHGCRTETVIAVSLTDKMILIGGTQYGGEMKKSVFGLLNYLLPAQGVMPMHCSANIGPNGDTAVFFGLSGTGKTTLSADASRTLIGDDEHGWSDTAVFNFEGGCYAKMIRFLRGGAGDLRTAALRHGARERRDRPRQREARPRQTTSPRTRGAIRSTSSQCVGATIWARAEEHRHADR